MILLIEMVLSHLFVQRSQYFRAQTPRESLSQYVLVHTISLYSHDLSVDIVSCKILSQSLTEV